MPDRDMIIRGCEYWIKNHKGEQLILEYTAVEDLLAILKEQQEKIAKLTLAFQTLPDWNPVVVRCKDCKECYFASNRIQSEQTFACGKHGIDVTQDWFCADGERK